MTFDFRVFLNVPKKRAVKARPSTIEDRLKSEEFIIVLNNASLRAHNTREIALWLRMYLYTGKMP